MSNQSQAKKRKGNNRERQAKEMELYRNISKVKMELKDQVENKRGIHIKQRFNEIKLRIKEEYI